MRAKRIVTVFLIGFIFISIWSCAELTQILQPLNVQKPRVNVSQVKLTGLNFSQADLDFKLKIENPNNVAISLAGFDYDFFINDHSFLKGQQDQQSKIEAKGASFVNIPVALNFKQLYETYQSLKNSDSIRYTLKTGLNFNLPILGKIRIPVSTSGRLPTLKMPKIKVKALKLENLGFTSAKLRLQLALENPNAWSMLLNKMDYQFLINGNQWIQGQLNQAQAIDKKAASVLDIPITLNFLQMGRTVYNLLTQPGALNYQLKGNADLQSSIKLLGHFTMPINQSGKVELLK